MRKLTESDVEFTIECLPEEFPIRGNALASGDDDEDRQAEESIQEQLDNGNEWAWCTVRVVASWEGEEGDDYLGCCSYASEADFCTEDGYWPDMKGAALDNLNEKLERAAIKLAKLDR